MSVRNRLIGLYREIPGSVKIVAVTKTVPVRIIMEAYGAGHRLFGENRAQELITKQPLLPDDIRWHFIGHLQTNKVKYIAPFVELIESVDSLKLLQEIEKQAVRNNRIMDCLLQFHIATEETKFGMDLSEAEELLQSDEFLKMQNISIKGVMGMASFTEDEFLIRSEFQNLHSIFTHLKGKYFSEDDGFCEISMGMTGDYKIALEEGSTIVRIGTAIFSTKG